MRLAQRKKELKKNKAERSKARDFALVKKDTKDLDDEIEKLGGLADPSATEKNRLAELKAELDKIMAKKEEYVQEHPEQRKLVYRARREKDEVNKQEPAVEQKRNVFNRHGLPRHPERSIYYDPVMNPYGVPPPGMPYMERPLRPDEVASDDEADDDDDVVMPEGPPPTSSNNDIIDSDDDIPMPEGPPPSSLQPPPLPPSNPLGGALLSPPPPLLTVHPLEGPPPFPTPLSHLHQHPGFIGHAPPQSFPPGFSPYPPASAFMQPHMPPPPPGFFPRVQSASSVQDPLSSIPHQTYQAHRINRLTPHPSLPPKPSSVSEAFSAGIAFSTTTATVSAEPQLRDLKKEATAFVPTSLKRKKPAVGISSSKVNAAPSLGGETDSSEPPPASRPDLVSSLKDRFGPVPAVSVVSPNSKGPAKGMQPSAEKKDDYQKFVEEMGDILGTARS